MSVLTVNIDARPYSGLRYTPFGKLRVTNKRCSEHFDETAKERHVTNGKVYDVIAVQGYGDLEDVLIENDIHEVTRLADFFFEEVT